jgi:hypothetical protein
MTINILGTQYTISLTTKKEEPNLADCAGFCDDSVKLMAVDISESDDPSNKKDLTAVRQKILRHEIVHAFLCESGLAECSSWAQNEEMVDWFAMQGMKIVEAWKEAGAI